MSDKIIVSGKLLRVEHWENKDTGYAGVTFTSEAGELKASDSYHTFEELYDHRIELFIALCRKIVDYGAALPHREKVLRSQLHADGSRFEGWFIMGICGKDGLQMTYHLPMSRWGDTMWVDEDMERAPEWDGHTPADVIARLKNL